MRKVILPIFALASVFVWVACDSSQPTAPNDLEASFDIGDAAHMDGWDNFYWLPPMVKNPNTSGTFIGSLEPTVIICNYWGLPVGEEPLPCSPGGAGVVGRETDDDTSDDQIYTVFDGPAGEKVKKCLNHGPDR